MRRRHLLIGTGIAAGAAGAPCVWAQKPLPNKAIRIVVPNAPGGAADITARAVGEHMARSLGQPVVIDNKPGAGGVVAGQSVASAPPDGYTLLLISSGSAVSEALFKALPFNTQTAFAPVGVLATFDLVIVSAGNGRFQSLRDLIAYARQNPGKVNLGTPSLGTTQHLAAEWFKTAAQLDLQVVPFKSTPDVITGIRSGTLDAGLDILSPLLAQIQSKALRPLAVTGAQASRVLPDVPTAQSAGRAGLERQFMERFGGAGQDAARRHRAPEQGRERRAGRPRRAHAAGKPEPGPAPWHAGRRGAPAEWRHSALEAGDRQGGHRPAVDAVVGRCGALCAVTQNHGQITFQRRLHQRWQLSNQKRMPAGLVVVRCGATEGAGGASGAEAAALAAAAGAAATGRAATSGAAAGRR